MPPRLALAAGALLCALLACASTAAAATQTKDDATGDVPVSYLGENVDLRQISWDVNADTVTLDLTMTNGGLSQYFVFIDTNKDGKSDFTVRGSTGMGPGVPRDEIDWKLETTPQSTAGCQWANGPFNSTWSGQELAASTSNVKGELVGQAHKFRISFPTSLIGGAQTFDWAAYGLTFDIFHNRFDYMPDGTNYDTGRPNPVTTVKDYCDENGDGVHSDPGDTQESQAGFVPLVMAEGFTFPDEAPSTTGGGGGGQPGGAQPGGGQSGNGFTALDTSATGRMPNVLKLRSDQARQRIQQAVGFVDFDVREVNLAKAPKGTGFGDVTEQTPAAGTSLSSSFGERPKVTLEVYAGPRPKGKQDCLDKLVKDVKGMEFAAALDALKKAGCRVDYDFKLGAGDKEVVSKVTPRSGDKVELQVLLPADAAKQNLFLNVRENPNQLSFDAPRPDEKYPGFNLLSSDVQRNCMTIQVIDRTGTLVQGANVRLDTSDVKAASDPRVSPTNANGETQICASLPKPGRLDIVTWVTGKNDLAIYGGHSFNVVNGDRMKTGSLWHTSSGRVLEKHKTGRWVETRPRGKDVRAAQNRQQDYGPLVNWLVWLFGGRPQANALSEPTIGSGQKLSSLCGGRNGSCAAVLAIGSKPVGLAEADLITLRDGRVVAAGSANVVAAGSANVVAAGSANVVAAGSANAVTGASSGVVAAGSANAIDKVVDARKANILSTYGSGILSDMGLGLISDNGLGLIGDHGSGLTAGVGGSLFPMGGRLISDNGLG